MRISSALRKIIPMMGIFALLFTFFSQSVSASTDDAMEPHIKMVAGSKVWSRDVLAADLAEMSMDEALRTWLHVIGENPTMRDTLGFTLMDVVTKQFFGQELDQGEIPFGLPIPFVKTQGVSIDPETHAITLDFGDHGPQVFQLPNAENNQFSIAMRALEMAALMGHEHAVDSLTVLRLLAHENAVGSKIGDLTRRAYSDSGNLEEAVETWLATREVFIHDVFGSPSAPLVTNLDWFQGRFTKGSWHAQVMQSNLFADLEPGSQPDGTSWPTVLTAAQNHLTGLVGAYKTYQTNLNKFVLHCFDKDGSVLSAPEGTQIKITTEETDDGIGLYKDSGKPLLAANGKQLFLKAEGIEHVASPSEGIISAPDEYGFVQIPASKTDQALRLAMMHTMLQGAGTHMVQMLQVMQPILDAGSSDEFAYFILRHDLGQAWLDGLHMDSQLMDLHKAQPDLSDPWINSMLLMLSESVGSGIQRLGHPANATDRGDVSELSSQEMTGRLLSKLPLTKTIIDEARLLAHFHEGLAKTLMPIVQRVNNGDSQGLSFAYVANKMQDAQKYSAEMQKFSQISTTLVVREQQFAAQLALLAEDEESDLDPDTRQSAKDFLDQRLDALEKEAEE